VISYKGRTLPGQLELDSFSEEESLVLEKKKMKISRCRRCNTEPVITINHEGRRLELCDGCWNKHCEDTK